MTTNTGQLADLSINLRERHPPISHYLSRLLQSVIHLPPPLSIKTYSKWLSETRTHTFPHIVPSIWQYDQGHTPNLWESGKVEKKTSPRKSRALIHYEKIQNRSIVPTLHWWRPAMYLPLWKGHEGSWVSGPVTGFLLRREMEKKSKKHTAAQPLPQHGAWRKSASRCLPALPHPDHSQLHPQRLLLSNPVTFIVNSPCRSGSLPLRK